jgi:iron complex transport system permease protein
VSAATGSVRVLRTRTGRVSLRLDVRAIVVGLLLAAATAALGTVALTTGDFPLPARDVLASLVGQADPGTDFVVRTLRLPRLLTGILVGAALGVSGAIFQTVTRNPLGSPDFIGLTVGASTGALVAILLVGGGALQVAAGALLGCLVTSVTVYALAFRPPGVQLVRLVLMGIGIAAMLEAFNSFLIIRARLEEAHAAQLWLVGSLGGRGWEHVWPVAAALAVLLPLAVQHGRRLGMLTLGDETAALHGVPVERTRLVLLGVAVALAAVATAAAGPVAFIALAAPQLAVRLTRSSGPGLLPAAAMGAFLLTASDWVAQRALASTPLPVGVATGAVGGCYLIWLLATEWRRVRL